MITPELAEFVQSGISVLVGTRDARLVADCGRAVGARVEEGGRELTVFLPKATSATCVENLRDNHRAAVCFSRAEDHRSIQVKGRVLDVRDADEEDRRAVDRYRAAYAGMLTFVGLPPRIVARLNYWPCHAVRLRVESLFVQTPGPGAGAPLPAPAGKRVR